MRGNVPLYEMRTPKSLPDALDLLHEEPGTWKPFAGGTDLMVLLEMGLLRQKNFLNIHGLAELRGITFENNRLTMGALTTFSSLQSHAAVQKQFPILVQAARSVGAVAIQNRATIGGNIANSSPAADSSPALLVYDAEVELISKSGSRWVPYRDFHTGYKQTLMQPGELIKAIALSPVPGTPGTSFYKKVGARNAQAISKIAFAGVTEFSRGQLNSVRIALGSVAPTPIRCSGTEAFLRGRKPDFKTINEAKKILSSEISPIDDIRSSSEYRLRVSLNLLEDFLFHVELDRKTH